MRILANRRIKHLFCWLLLIVVGFSVISVAVVSLKPNHGALYVLTCAICMGALVFAVLYHISYCKSIIG